MFSFVKKSKPIFNSQYNSGVFSIPLCHGNERTEHPTQKPLSLFENLIKIYTNENNVVLDNTAGVCTTAIACKNLKRKWICIEQEQKYCDISVERIKNYEKI